MRIIPSVLAGVLSLCMGAGSQAQLLGAIAPEVRTAYPGGPDVTFFFTALNNTTEPLTGCFPSDPDISSYQTVTAANVLIGTPDTPADIAPGASQGFVIVVDTPQTLENGIVLTISPQVDCMERNSDARRTGRAFVTIRDPSSELNSRYGTQDLVVIGVTPSADGVVRIDEAGGSQVFAAAAVNIGGPGPNLVVQPLVDLADVSATVCETDETGACKAEPNVYQPVDFSAGEVKTFSVFITAQERAGVLFLPDLYRVGLFFSRDQQVTREGQATAAVTAPAPSDDTPLTGVYNLRLIGEDPENDRSLLDLRGRMILGPDGRFIVTTSVDDILIPAARSEAFDFSSMAFSPTRLKAQPEAGSDETRLTAQGAVLDTRTYAFFDREFLYKVLTVNSEMLAYPNVGVIGTLVPDTAAGPENTLPQNLSLYASFDPRSEEVWPITEIARGWTLISLNSISAPNIGGSMSLEADGSFSGNMLGACIFAGNMEILDPSRTVFSVTMRFEQDACPPELAPSTLRGFGYYTRPESPGQGSRRLIIDVQDVNAPHESSISLTFW